MRVMNELPVAKARLLFDHFQSLVSEGAEHQTADDFRLVRGTDAAAGMQPHATDVALPV